MNTEEFKARFGREPELDDLDRANCHLAGLPGHKSCGVCVKHGRLVFECEECFVKSAHGNQVVREAGVRVIRVQIDNNIVKLQRVDQESWVSPTIPGQIVYMELNGDYQPMAEHSFIESQLGIAKDPSNESKDILEYTASFFTNGHHYRTGDMMYVHCKCGRCNKTETS